MKNLLIGLTGRMGSGKGELVKILENKGFKKTSLSDMVRAEVRKRGKEVTRGEMQDIGNELRKNGGAGILGKLVKELIEKNEPASWVIDGIRNPAEVEFLRKLPDFILLGVEASTDILLSRIKSRERDTDKISDEEIKSVLDREWGIGEPPDGQRVGDCMKIADYIIKNEGSLENLDIELNKILEKTGEKNG